MIDRITIIGVGLIGGSLGLSLKQSRYCREVIGYDRDESELRQAVHRGVIDVAETSVNQAVSAADIVVLAVPVGAMRSVLTSILGSLPAHAVVTDVGSSKASVVSAARAVFGGDAAPFVPAHPIAGREKSGVGAAVADLFVGHKVILCPLEENPVESIRSVRNMWSSTGAQVETLGVQQHDQVLAATSHLPHVIAYSLVNTLSKTEYVDEIFEFAAGGFRDLSRVASSDPVMWRDICLENRDAILAALEAYQVNLAGLKKQIADGDGSAIYDAFLQAKTIRDANVMKYKTRLE